MTLRADAYRVLERTDRKDLVGRTVDLFLIALITVNLLAVVLETVDWLNAAYSAWFFAIEVVSVAIFTSEYALRLWSCVEGDNKKSATIVRVR